MTRPLDAQEAAERMLNKPKPDPRQLAYELKRAQWRNENALPGPIGGKR